MSATTKKPQPKIADPDGDWTIVLHRRQRRRKKEILPSNTESSIVDLQPRPWAPINIDPADPEKDSKLLQEMHKCIERVDSSDFYTTLLDQIQAPQVLDSFTRVLGSESCMQMVIYGIGSIESNNQSRLQLSLAILVKRKFDWIGDIEVFDPIISTAESKVLEALGCSILLVNEQARRQALKPTLFFMPHCELRLYENLLSANWRAECLNRMVLFGNSFDRYEQYSSELKSSSIYKVTKHVLCVRKFSTEVRIETVSSDFFKSFHDSSWHFFNLDQEMDLELQSILL